MANFITHKVTHNCSLTAVHCKVILLCNERYYIMYVVIPFIFSQELDKEIQEKSGIFHELIVGARRALSFFSVESCDYEFMSSSINAIHTKFESLTLSVQEMVDHYNKEVHQLMLYLNKVKSLSEKLSAVHTNLYDECCTAVSNTGNMNKILQQKSTLQV